MSEKSLLHLETEALLAWEKIKRESELKPCPFCNSDRTWLGKDSIKGHWRVVCDGCAAQGPIEQSLQYSNAKKLWNNREAKTR